MSERIEALKSRLAESRRRVNEVLDQVGDRWDTQVYSEGAAWNVRQLLVHMSLSDKGLNGQAMGIAEDKEVIPADFDLELFNRRSVEKRGEMTVEEARANMEKSRQDLLAWLDGITDESVLNKEGRMAALEIMSVEKLVHHVANHEETHANDIARVLGIQ
jgi:hypothetical protein